MYEQHGSFLRDSGLNAEGGVASSLLSERTSLFFGGSPVEDPAG